MIVIICIYIYIYVYTYMYTHIFCFITILLDIAYFNILQLRAPRTVKRLDEQMESMLTVPMLHVGFRV